MTGNNRRVKDQVQAGPAMTRRQHVDDLFARGREHEMRHELVPARGFLEEALVEATAAGMMRVTIRAHLLLGVVSHKENDLVAARPHLETGLTMALAAGDTQLEAYVRQEVGFLLLGEGEPETARTEFLRVVGLAPGVGIVNLTGNGLSGMGVALLALGRTQEAIPLLLGALGLRTEIGDLEQQHLDLVHLANAALLLGNKPVAGSVTGFLAGSPETSKGMYAHDRRTFDTVVSAVGPGPAAAGFDEARSLVASLTAI
jgi:tetratricopeptide (TPR) repeat protein